jgi:hypothetical protein
MTTTPSTLPVSHRTRFFDHRIPALSAGAYTIITEHKILEEDTGDTLPVRTQDFDVRALRFTIAAADVHACYPTPGTAGSYSQLLPHITLDTPALPWLRTLDGQPDELPWLALLLFRAGELPEDELALGQVRVLTVRELISGTAAPGQPPAIDPDYVFDDEFGISCNTVLVPGELLDAIMPVPAEITLLAHVREGGPPDAQRNTDPEPHEADLNSVLVANRFPGVLGGRYVVHLMSLDGWEAQLDGAACPAAGARMVSLWSWTFESEPDSTIGFGDLANDLATEREPAGSLPDLRLRVRAQQPASPSAAQRAALERLNGGWTALPQRLESGELSFGFYRGPLCAQPAQPLPAPAAARLESPGEALIYLQQHGVYDTSYAAAFALGRSLALADATFREHLFGYRAEARSAARRLLTHPQLAGRRDLAATALAGNLARTAMDRLLFTQNGARFAGALASAGADLRAGRRRAVVTAARSARPRGAELRQALTSADARGVLREALSTAVSPVTEWLDRLRLLEFIGLEHLVADERMLPAESLRFFWVDAKWIRAAVDGALSIGVGHALDAALNDLAVDGITPPACGVLIRSELVENWPKTIYTAFSAGRPVEPRRRAVYGTDVLLLLYPEAIDAFTLAEPPQGLHFGVGDEGTIELRKLDGDDIGMPMGDFPDTEDNFGQFLRVPATPGVGEDVLNIVGAGNALMPPLAAKHGRTVLTPSQFALQMVKAPQLQTIERP